METKNSHFSGTIEEIDPNPFFRAFNSIIIDVTNAFDSQDTVEVEVTDSTPKFKFNKEQISFFENLYVPANSYTPSNHIKKVFVQNNYPELLDIPHGYNEWQLIDFITDPRYDLSNLASIVAPIGHGKSSLLQYTLLYIREKVPSLKAKFIPLIFNCHEFKVFFKDSNNRMRIFDYLSNEIFLPRLATVLNPYIDIDNEEFWDYYIQHAKSYFVTDAQSIMSEISSAKSESLKEELYHKLNELKRSEIKTEKFAHTALRYLKFIKKIEVVLALDNLDLLGIDTVESFIDFVERLQINSSIKVLLVFRSVTYNKLMERYRGALAETVHEWTPISSKDVIDKRCNDLNNRIIREAERINFQINNISIKISDISVAIKNITSVISKNHEIITLFSNGNLRLQMKLLRILIKSGWLPNWVYHTALWSEMDFKLVKEIPNYIILQALTTNNYGTYIDEKNKFPKVPGLLNVLSSNSEIVVYNFLPMMILSNLKNSNYNLINLKSLHELIVQFYDFYDDDIVLDRLFYSTITDLLNGGLITSPEAYEIEVGDDIGEIVKNIRMSILGKYYINSLIYDYNYIVNIKDEVQLRLVNFSGCIENRKLCEAEGYVNYYKFTRLNIEDILKFFEEYGNLEMEFLKIVKAAKRVVAYKSLFCSTNNFFYSSNMVQNVFNQFNNAKFLHSDLLSELKSLVTKLENLYSNELGSN